MMKSYKIILIVLVLILLLPISIIAVNMMSKNTESNEVTVTESEEEVIYNTDDSESLEGIEILTEYEVYSQDTKEVKVKWFSTLDDEIMYGNYFSLEKKVDDQWVIVRKETDEFIGFTLIGYILGYGDESWQTFNTSVYAETLEIGQYRIATDFHRETLNGNSYGAGNYPRYPIYAYFEVGQERIKREMDKSETEFEYLNDPYGYSITFPSTWKGFSLIVEVQDSKSPLHEMLNKLDKDYFVLRHRHPDWTEETPYQDIVFVMVKREEWNKHADEATSGVLGLLPQTVLSNHEYLFVHDPYHYKGENNGYYDVVVILKNKLKKY